VLIIANSGNNTFILNNFTGTSGLYANDLNGSNFYNALLNGIMQGNEWADISNNTSQSWSSFGAVYSSKTPFKIADTFNGSAITTEYGCYNLSNSAVKKITANVIDCAPLVLGGGGCVNTISYLWNMTATNTLLHRATNPTWLAQLFQATSLPSLCFKNITAYVYTGNTTLMSIAFTTANTSITLLNNTGVPNDVDVFANVTVFDNFGGSASTETRQYTMILDTNTSESDSMIFSVLIGLAIFALLFGYMHVNSKSEIWANLWFFMACMMVMGELMAIYTYAGTEGNTAIQNVSFALLIGFLWVFILSIWVFLFKLIKDFINALREAFKRG
jgi:hypothetical protein